VSNSLGDTAVINIKFNHEKNTNYILIQRGNDFEPSVLKKPNFLIKDFKIPKEDLADIILRLEPDPRKHNTYIIHKILKNWFKEKYK
jgi:hypothetical protein